MISEFYCHRPSCKVPAKRFVFGQWWCGYHDPRRKGKNGSQPPLPNIATPEDGAVLKKYVVNNSTINLTQPSAGFDGYSNLYRGIGVVRGHILAGTVNPAVICDQIAMRAIAILNMTEEQARTLVLQQH